MKLSISWASFCCVRYVIICVIMQLKTKTALTILHVSVRVFLAENDAKMVPHS